MMPLTTKDTFTKDDQWKLWEENEYYSWQSGKEQWNKYTSVKNTEGELVSFVAPIRFAYTHTKANDVNDNDRYNNKKFNLEFDGYELQIPWKYDDVNKQWKPMINIKDGTVLTASDNTEYVVKGTEEELNMQKVDPSNAADLSLDKSIEPPDLEYDSAKTDKVGDIPEDTELKIIKGELVEE
jgi:hypothetical protein